MPSFLYPIRSGSRARFYHEGRPLRGVRLPGGWRHWWCIIALKIFVSGDVLSNRLYALFLPAALGREAERQVITWALRKLAMKIVMQRSCQLEVGGEPDDPRQKIAAAMTIA